MFLKISKNLQENTRARVSFLIELQASASACNFIKKETLVQVFSCEICEIFKKTFFYRAPPVAASETSMVDFFAKIVNGVNLLPIYLFRKKSLIKND